MAPHSLTGSPHSRSRALTARTLQVRSWKIDAASAASARPAENTSTKCSGAPAPPDAMTGMPTASDTAAVSAAVEPAQRAVGVDRGEQDLAGAARLGFAGPLDGVPRGGRAAGVAADDEPSGLALRVDGDDDGLAAVAGGRARDERGVANRRGVEATLSAPASMTRAASSTDRMPPPTASGNEHARGDGRHGAREGEPVLDRGGDVEHDQLVDAFGVVAGGELGRVAGVAEPLEVQPFTTRPSRTSRQAIRRLANVSCAGALMRAPPMNARSTARPSSPDFSGWNCTPQTLPRAHGRGERRPVAW